MKDFNAWKMPPPPFIPKQPAQMSAPKQRLEWMKPDDYIRFQEQQRLSQTSPSIQSVASTDFRDGILMASTPLPTELGDEGDRSEHNFDQTESICNRTRRQIKSWTPQEFAKLKKSQPQKAEEENFEEGNEFNGDDTLSLPELVSMHSIGSLEDIQVSVADATLTNERSATVYMPQDDDTDSSGDERYENNVYEMMKSISSLALDITLVEDAEDQEMTEAGDYSYERFETYDDSEVPTVKYHSNYATDGHSQSQSSDDSEYAPAVVQAEPIDDENCAARLPQAEVQLDTIEFESQTVTDPEATMLDALQFIKTLRSDDDIYLAKFPEVIVDASLQLKWQEVPKSGEIEVFISEVYSPQHFWFQYTHEVEEMMDMMDEDYSKLRGKQLMISDERLVPGLLVACYLPDFERWHRAKVIRGMNSSDEVRLLILDYGTVGNIKKHRIRYLFKKYLNYPRYSHRGRFENLKPSNGEKSWNEQQVTKFLVKVSDTKLSAKVVKFHEDECWFELDMTLNKNSSNPINLRNWLIGSWLCEPFTLRPGNIYPMCYYFPSFDMLEKNHPAFHEKTVLMTQGIDYDLLVDTNYFENVNEETLPRRPRLLSMLGRPRYRDAKKFYFT